MLAAWTICFVLHLDASVGGRLAWIPVAVEGAEDAEGFPAVRSFWTAQDAARSGLLPGDRMLAVGDVPLRGQGTLGVAARVYGAAEGDLVVPVQVERAGSVQRVLLGLRPVPHPWRVSLLSAAFVSVGALAFWRRPRARSTRLFLLATAVYSLHWCYFWGAGPPARSLAAFAVFGLGGGVGIPLAVTAALAFPEDVAPRRRAAWLAPWLLAPVGVGAVSWAFGWPLPSGWGVVLALGGSLAAFAAIGGILLVHFRRTGPLGRRQIKWVVLGTLAAFTPPALAALAALAVPGWWWIYELSLVALLLLPLALFVALARDQLFDVDRLLTAATTLSLLGVVLLAGLIALVPRVAEAAQAVVDPSVGQPALALLCALGLVAARARVQPRVERWLFPERPRFEREAAALRRTLGECGKPTELFAQLGAGLRSLLRPEGLVVYGRSGGGFAPLFESGPAVAPAFAADGPLFRELDRERRVLDVETLALRMGSDLAAHTDRAALQAMGTRLVVPVVPEDEMSAFVCLGAKRSGSEYGASELALLQSVADKAGDELRRFALEEVRRDQAAMAERLRRYVPGALADHLERGAELPAGEREVSVLFVDLRGYTALSEAARPESVFSLISRYTETVSEVVAAHGGAVVDFQGDGLMAVFGAPASHPEKERAAVAAAHAVVAAVRALPSDAGPRPVTDVGVGVATGAAFVGHLRAVDRTIWCVLGDTTNRAARFQALTRELDVHVVIDAATHRAAGAPEAFAPRPGVSLRGRREPVDLFVLSVPAAPLPPGNPEEPA